MRSRWCSSVSSYRIRTPCELVPAGRAPSRRVRDTRTRTPFRFDRLISAAGFSQGAAFQRSLLARIDIAARRQSGAMSMNASRARLFRRRQGDCRNGHQGCFSLRNVAGNDILKRAREAKLKRISIGACIDEPCQAADSSSRIRFDACSGRNDILRRVERRRAKPCSPRAPRLRPASARTSARTLGIGVDVARDAIERAVRKGCKRVHRQVRWPGGPHFER